MLIQVVQQRRGPVAGTYNGTDVRFSDLGEQVRRRPRPAPPAPWRLTAPATVTDQQGHNLTATEVAPPVT
ncbi:hypothetical protein [Saccharothrix saharensis]|uniref:hypothetical protein n=1 Tax=Saccharothrix saharensis TaxID=571190 RepID=UPI0011518FDA|nr:hypothetical protein [Saccharothrix saharensis]